MKTKLNPCCKEHLKTPYDPSNEPMGLVCLMKGYETESRVCPVCYTTAWRSRSNIARILAIRDGDTTLYWDKWYPFSYEPTHWNIMHRIVWIKIKEAYRCLK